MLSRYKLLLSTTLARYFPRTAAYLEAERHATAERLKSAAKTAGKPAAGKKAAAKRAGKGAGAKGRGQGGGAPKKPVRRPSAGVYSAVAMKITAAQEQAMRDSVARAVAAGVVGAPSDEQWAMILARQPLTRIFAGAGSGKSTTLVLRVVFMLCHLNIEPERLTVISFTHASCVELRERLSKLLAFWQSPVDERAIQQCVRTFHAAMGVLARQALGNPGWFEQLGDKRAAASEPDNPLAGGRLGAAQGRLLKEVYQACYAADPAFRAQVHRLLGSPAPDEHKPLPKAPLQPFRLTGELHAVPLFEVFYGQAGFIESIGIRIDQLAVVAVPCSDQERLFLLALQAFWRTLQQRLGEQGLMTFNGAFQQLTQMLDEGDGRLPAEALASFSHLLIDEFQDVSPQIVQWLQAVHRRLAGASKAVSLMAIGDDWQSIYAWRGSSPELFMAFDRHFPSKGKGQSAVLMLQANYRSIEPLIRDAESILREVASKQDKATEAIRVTPPGGHGVQLVTPFDLARQMPDLLKEIAAQCEYASAIDSTERTAVLLLGRRNETLKEVQAGLGRKLPVKAYTIHRAKGLQAEVAIILDDCLPPTPHPLRNALYAYCGFFANSYDQVMADESLRLGYVAVTRGVSRVLWFVRKPQGATGALN
ncbi:UvrD/REP helicase N-terminal domain-containing protein [Pseudomonas flavescens]|uniref:UvrD/REP helicase N-terminal domain-containing protein n=1 Tax=Phytopseudomonas flavescens TaxID=29435 RepID=A0A1G8K6S6_9GAMM|nr:DEAD/DEAH box helicase [Pseudomonas flavescens]SDI39039.1 UvrD/REP helicase N-terminal domain-containing protein [Pseudomonas flavescens]